MKNKILLLICILSIYIGFYATGSYEIFNLRFLQLKLSDIQSYELSNPLMSILISIVIYAFVSGLSVPGASILTLLNGAVFGLLKGIIITSFASSIGATIAMLISRYLFQDFVRKKYQINYQRIQEEFVKNGLIYLLSLRLIPIFPFFVVNLVMGITNISIKRFYFISQLGMLPGTFAYVNAGLQLSRLKTISNIISYQFLSSILILLLIPWISRFFIMTIKRNRVYRKYKEFRPDHFEYDMVVIGAGAAGLVTSNICANLKAKVALIEKHKMGGDCLNTGCVPSKTIIHTAQMIYTAKKTKQFGISIIDSGFDFKKVMEKVYQKIREIEPHDSKERYEEMGISCFVGNAKIRNPWTIQIGDKIITTRNITIATGAFPSTPEIEGLNEINYYTSDSIWKLDKCPRRMLILGAGPIGLELAQVFTRLGAKVIILEKNENILLNEDEIVSKYVMDFFKSEGVEILTSHTIKSFSKNLNDINCICDYNKEEKIIRSDCVLIAVGRQARVRGFGLEDLGIELSKKGDIIVNQFMQTNYPNIFACGDVVGPFQFTSTAAYQAKYCAINGLFGKFKKITINYNTIPRCIYTDPEIATVGLSEKLAIRLGIEYDITKFNFDELDRAITDSQTKGFIQVLTVKGKDKILGATIVGSQASNLISELTLSMNNNIGLSKLLNTIHPYPTMSEAIFYVASNWRKNHVPNWIKKCLEIYFSLR